MRTALFFHGAVLPVESKEVKVVYAVNDVVLYGGEGVCKIADIEKRNFHGKEVEYYVLKPLYGSSSTVYVPTQNTTLTDRIRRILSPEEIFQLIQTMPDKKSIWIENENHRKERYQQILKKGDREELVRLIKTLYLHREAQAEKGKKLHIADEQFFREAEHILYEEFAHVLKISQDQVLPYIMEQIGTPLEEEG